MWRAALAIPLIVIAGYVAINLLVTTEPERVEARVARLCDLAREGGEDAAQEILDSFAEDYRGEGTFSRARVEYYVRRFIGSGQITELTTGDYAALWVDDEIVVPILSIQAKTERGALNPIFRVTFAERDGEWLIVNVGRWRLER